jgi:hypothetical protein
MVWIVLGCALLVAAWLYVHRRVMHGHGAGADSGRVR